MALQLLGRLLHSLSGMPPPTGKEVFAENGLAAEAGRTKSEGGEQFAFGANWRQFVEKGRLSSESVLSSTQEVRRAIGGAISSFKDLRILDLGCGSGLHSLAFHLLGGRVTSVDVQEDSMEATRRLREAFATSDSGGVWDVTDASALNAKRLASLPVADIVYTWGVLHHTGDLWQGLHNAQLPLAPDGLLLAAVYASEYYDEKENLMLLKRAYLSADARRREHLEIVLGIHWLRPLMMAGRNPFEIMREFSNMRGMNFWTDVRDWLGGWPMEFASTSEVLAFARRSGLHCVGVRRYGGNTEYALTRRSGVQRWTANRVCTPLDAFEEDRSGSIASVQRRFYYWSDEGGEGVTSARMASKRRWWKSQLPKSFVEYSDDMVQPQRDRLLLVDADGVPFGYPTAHFARPDALADHSLTLHAFWEGMAYVSPGETAIDSIKGLQACLLPSAVLSESEDAAIRVAAERGLARLSSQT
eukprot:TRINITY_DN72031_c0_g1_i1.p1 TRINITY_DN72031_c0_g1~~TRINITY_DN72031_c0_g1_i1.p1  ORF type:complete len:484 (+),score=47.61 TRINITY_DN72031_c0_g1_i1:38-1453(+)